MSEAPTTDESADTTDVLALLAPVSDLLHVEIVSGVPLLFARREGPTTAGLMFRVGWADEPVARAGITHLIEHLAVFDYAESGVLHHAVTQELTTFMHATGSDADVVGFLNGVAASLRNGLRLDRMAAEKNVLRAEAASRSFDAFRRHRLERHGLRGRGLAGFDTVGLDGVTEAVVRGWVREYFTSGNVVALVAGERIPDGLDLALPPGARRATPPVDTWTPPGPSHFEGTDGMVVVDAIIPRSPAALLFAGVASRALFRELRLRGALSYAPSCRHDDVDAQRVRLTVTADSTAADEVLLSAGVRRVLLALQAGEVDANDLRAARTEYDRWGDGQSPGAAILHAAAFDALLGIDVWHPGELARRVSEVRPEDIALVAAQFLDDALVQLPAGVEAWDGFPRTPQWSTTRVAGRIHPKIGDRTGALIVGEEGVSIAVGDDTVTVTYADCVLLERWPDGARRLRGSDGFLVMVEPTLHANISRAVLDRIDAAVPAEMHVDRPRRTPEAIPERPTIPPAEVRSHLANGFLVAFVLMTLLFLVGAGLTLNDAMHIDVPFADGTHASGSTVVGGMLVTAGLGIVAIGFLVLAVRRQRRAERGRT